MLAVVALVLASLRDVATDIPRDTSYVMRSIVSCPDEGYFFKREASPNGANQVCYLCFCQDNSTAVCWRRQNRRCDVKHYYSIEQRRTRERRSPISLGEVSIRDAAGEFFNRQPSKHCKPLESSFSNGCPPADWCIGCTVCDCDANARWDCHLLSFCPDKNGNKQIKKHHGPLKNGISKRQSKPSSTKAVIEVTKKPSKDPTRRPLQKQNMRRNKVKQNLPLNKHKIDPVKGTKLKKFTPVKKSKVSKINLNKGNQSTKRVTGKPLAIRKSILNSSRSSIKPNEDTFAKNNSAEVDQKVLKQFMSSMQKIMKNIEMKNDNSSKEANAIFKRSMQKQYNSKKFPRTDKERPKFITKPISITKANKKNKGRRTTPPVLIRFDKTGRIKRQVKNDERKLEMPLLNLNGTTERVYLFSTLSNDTEIKTADVYNLEHNDTNTTDYYPVHNFTGNSIFLETNKNYIITDNHVYEANNSHKIFYHNVDNLTTLHYFTRNSSLSTSYSFNNDLTTQSMRGIVIIPNLDFTPKMSKHNNTNINLKENQGVTNKTESIVHKIDKTDIGNYTKSKHHVKNTTHYNYGLRSLFHSLFSENQIDPKLIPKKPKRFTILSKLKRIFRKIYQKNNKIKFNGNNDFDSLDYSKFQSKYAKSGHDINELRQKIDKLRDESINVLKTLRKLKGLLQILELSTNKSINKIDSNDSNGYVKKIDKILKDTFVIEEIAHNLTDDQRIQIKSIKDNVQIFIKSIGRFATILDEIIQIDLHHNRINQNKTINTTMKIHSKYKNNDEYKGIKIQQKVKKLKELMMNYNLLQSKFTRQINSILNSLESSNTSNNKIVQDNRSLQMNKTDAIETNSANIIRNIRRLKILADKLKSHNRKKRETIGDEDALGYVLLLMEYLLRSHVNTNPPVNDGIDLLIEAIKKAPNVKPIKKNVLDYSNTPKISQATRNARPIYKSFTEDSTENASTQVDEIKTRTSSKSQSGDDDSDDDNIDEIYQRFKSFSDSSSDQQDFVLATTKSYQKIEQEDYSHQNSNSSRRFEPENDSETEEVSSTILSNFALNSESPIEYPTTIHSDDIKTSPRIFEKSTSSENKLLVDTKGNIDWIEENFRDLKQMREVDIKLSTPKTIHVTRTSKKPGADNLSDITNEMDTNSKKKVKKPSAEELILKKEMSLLNSLDYKDFGDESVSKDDKFTEFS